MCGHVGIAGNLSYKDEGTMKRLLLMDFFRGPDSTGFAQVKTNNDAVVVKKAINPIDFFDLPAFKSALSGANSLAFIGHNRASTVGVTNNMNAHPFQCGHITGAHNGTLDNLTIRELEDMLAMKCGTDSELIFNAIETLGAKDAIPLLRKGSDKSRGAWSLVWHDSKLKTINFVRNEWRPMWYAFNKECDRIFWASEWPMIDAAIRLSATGYEMYKDDKGMSYFPTDEDVWCSFDLEALKKGGKRPKPKVVPLAGKEMKVAPPANDPFDRHGTSSSRGGNGGMTTIGTQTSRGGQSTSSTTTYRSKEKRPIQFLNMEGDDEAPYGNFIGEKEFKEWTKYGCHWCEEHINYGDQGITIWERDGIVICKSCSDSDKSQRPTRIYIPDLHQLI